MGPKIYKNPDNNSIKCNKARSYEQLLTFGLPSCTGCLERHTGQQQQQQNQSGKEGWRQKQLQPLPAPTV